MRGVESPVLFNPLVSTPLTEIYRCPIVTLLTPVQYFRTPAKLSLNLAPVRDIVLSAPLARIQEDSSLALEAKNASQAMLLRNWLDSL